MLDKVDELFSSIENSNEYREYKKIGNILEKDPNISILIQEIKELQKEATYLESNNDIRYKEVDEIINKKVEELNQNKIYQEYLDKMKEFNKLILNSSSIIENYINDKI